MTKEQLRKSWRRSFAIALTATMLVNTVITETVVYAAEFTAPESNDQITVEESGKVISESDEDIEQEESDNDLFSDDSENTMSDGADEQVMSDGTDNGVTVLSDNTAGTSRDNPIEVPEDGFIFDNAKGIIKGISNSWFKQVNFSGDVLWIALKIPKKINGTDVKAISNYALQYRSNGFQDEQSVDLSKIKIASVDFSYAENLELIGNCAFDQRSELAGGIDLSNTKVKKIGEAAFRGTAVQGVILPDSLEELGVISERDGFGAGVFDSCRSLEYVRTASCKNQDKPLILPANLKIIGSHAFRYCFKKGMNISVEIPENVEAIGAEAFNSSGSGEISAIYVKRKNGYENYNKRAFQTGVSSFVIFPDAESYNCAVNLGMGNSSNTHGCLTYQVTVKFIGENNETVAEQTKLFNQYIWYTKTESGLWNNEYQKYTLPVPDGMSITSGYEWGWKFESPVDEEDPYVDAENSKVKDATQTPEIINVISAGLIISKPKVELACDTNIVHKDCKLLLKAEVSNKIDGFNYRYDWYSYNYSELKLLQSGKEPQIQVSEGNLYYVVEVIVSDGKNTENGIDNSEFCWISQQDHEWEYIESANVVTAKCMNNAQCQYANGVTLTLNAEDMLYTGQTYNLAKVDNNITDATGETASDIHYYNTDENENKIGDPLAEAPSALGTYIAEVTIGGKTASKVFHIKKQTVFEKGAETTSDAPVKEASLDNSKNDLLEHSTIFEQEEKEKIENNIEDARVWLKIDKAEESNLTEDQKNKLQKGIKDYAGDSAQCVLFNAELFKQVGTDVKQIKNPGTEIQITIKIPDNILLKDESSVNREYKILRLHTDDQNVTTTDWIAGKFNRTTSEFTFSTDKFSVFAIAYKDVHYSPSRPSYPVTGVTVSSDKTTLTKEGETTQITATVTPSYADNKNVTWKSSDEKIATVDKNGKVTAVGNGTVTITATTVDGKYSATTTITVKIAPEKLTLTAEKTNLTKIGDSLQITAKVEPDNAYKKLIWKSSDEKVAIVDSDGKVTAVGNGTVTITATTEDGKLTESVTITVKIPDEPTVNETTGYGRLKARSVVQTNNSIKLEWTRVSGADGYIIYGNYCNGNGKVYKYNKITTITNGKTRTWTHTKLKKATYYKYIVKAYKVVNGKKVITDTSVSVHATTTGGKYGVAKAVSITKIGNKKNVREVTLKKGKTAQITATEIKKDKPIRHHRNICYESSNTKVATVTPDGVIQAKGKGTCTIWVYAQNGVYKTVTVTVK